MKLSQKQQKELEVLTYFMPNQYKREITDNDVERYFLKSERGIGTMPEFMEIGKKWREVHMADYKKDWKEGTFWLFEAKEDFPKPVFEYICKSIMGFIPEKLK